MVQVASLIGVNKRDSLMMNIRYIVEVHVVQHTSSATGVLNVTVNKGIEEI